MLYRQFIALYTEHFFFVLNLLEKHHNKVSWSRKRPPGTKKQFKARKNKKITKIVQNDDFGAFEHTFLKKVCSYALFGVLGGACLSVLAPSRENHVLQAFTKVF